MATKKKQALNIKIDTDKKPPKRGHPSPWADLAEALKTVGQSVFLDTYSRLNMFRAADRRINGTGCLLCQKEGSGYRCWRI